MGNMLRGIGPRFGATAPDPDDRFAGAIRIDRARRLHTTHQRGPSRRCGLCLQSWPCPERNWAERTLRDAAKPETPSRWSIRWAAPLWSLYR
jgi:hypothetical protein